jgi:predicted pyridoxine 5'-phosphate oxidase superfamily flavin-nucleotide-binding protein
MICLSQNSAWFAERPGNRRADSFRNILAQPRVAIAALVPGTPHVALLSGNARLSTGGEVRAAFTVREKPPRLATCVDSPEVRIYDSAALSRAQLWPAPRSSAFDAAGVITQHVRLSKTRGLQATFVRALLSVPGLTQKGLDRDYKDNLY